MTKYMLRYIIFWLPALIVAYAFNNNMLISHVLQWLFAFFLIFGWAANTGMAAYELPRQTLVFLFIYIGVTILIIVGIYSTDPREIPHVLLRHVAGATSVVPLSIMMKALHDFNIPHEAVVSGVLVGGCIIGYIAGVVSRRVNPNPYRPRMKRAG